MPASATEIAPGVVRFEKILPTGWSLNMFAVRGVEEDGVVLHSPTHIDAATYDAVAALGPVRALVCPNHFHWLSVRRYKERFPEARVVADPGAIPRLEKRLGFAPEAATGWAAWRTPEGLENGEGWISLPGDGGPTWITSDAFFNVRRPVTGFTGFMLRALRTVPGPCLGSTFRWLAIRDRRAYKASLLRLLDGEKPARILVSHGDAIEGEGLAGLRGLIDARLG